MKVASNGFQYGAVVTAMLIVWSAAGWKRAEAQVLTVEQAVICKNVVDRMPVDAGKLFPASTGRLFCFTKIVGASRPTEITHVWYFDGTERDRVHLSVGGSPWRTYSSKRLRPHEIGAWHVDILDQSGNILERLTFDVVR